MLMMLFTAYSFSQTITVDIASVSTGTAEEDTSDGDIAIASSDLEFYHDGDTEQVVGIHFEQVNLPEDAVITNAYIQFQADQEGAGDVTVNITGDASDNAVGLSDNGDYGISSRTATTANVDWAIASWVGQKDEASENQRTPDISAVITEIISRDGWVSGNNLAFVFTGVSRSDGAWREAESGTASGGPILHLVYTSESVEVGATISTADISISSDNGSGEEDTTDGYVSVISSDLEFYHDGDTEQIVGLHFDNINIPKHATISKAYIQFQADQDGAGDVTVNIQGDDSDNALGLKDNGDYGLSKRTATSANVDWDIASWVGQIGYASENQRTPDISAIISEITSRDGWALGNSMAFTFTGVSRSDGAWREAESNSDGTPTLHLEYITPPAEITVYGNSLTIASGNVTPDVLDDTQFGDIGINQIVTKTYTITNIGEEALNLSGDPIVSLTGDSAFTISVQPEVAILEAGEHTEFEIEFIPTAIEAYTATVSIINNDTDENPYTFNIAGSGATPVLDLDVLGNDMPIENGDITPDVLDNTDFGSIYTFIERVKTFTIQNTGNSVLTIGSVTSSADDFTIISAPESTLNIGASTTFQVLFTPLSAAEITSVITVNSDDEDDNVFTFTVKGEGINGTFPAAISAGDSWFYSADGTDHGTDWRLLNFDQGNWIEGATEIGYGDGDETTDIGQPATPRPITTYFRKYITIEDTSLFNSLDIEAVRDDGIIVYINNVEVWRNNLPTSETISFNDEAESAIAGDDESAWNSRSVSVEPLVNGVNVISVEIHQSGSSSSDISFNFKLTPSEARLPSAYIERGPYLQSGTAHSVIVKWRTDNATESVVNYGTSLDALTLNEVSEDLTTEHEVVLTGLTPNTKYYYNIGNNTEVLSESTTGDMYVITSPEAGTDQFIRAWILGDPGTANTSQREVRDAYYNYVANATENTGKTDMMLFLGDNAYSSGTDLEYQYAFFDVYDEMLKKSVAWSCLGNHDGYTADSDTQSGPYYDIYSFPTQAEAGGTASGTEAYYAFDYGNIHFIILDSHHSSRAVGDAMYNWAQTDIQNTTQDWIVTLFHHPAYSKGSHDSDYEDRLIDMRENFMPLLEANGVDLVLNGHSHSYERSYFINGHQGASNTFNIDEVSNGGHTVGATGSGDGKADGTGVYQKTLDATEGAVYITTGSAGQTSGGDLNHQAMSVSLNELGSCVMEIESDGNGGQNLNIKFVRDNGDIDDYFTINKSGVTLSVDQTDTQENSIKIYPVPANDLLNIKVNLNENFKTAKIYNNTGALVKSTTDATVNVSNLASGMYVVEIKTDKNTYYKSVIIE